MRRRAKVYQPKVGEKLVCGFCPQCGDHVAGIRPRELMGNYCVNCDRGLELCYEHPHELVPRPPSKKAVR
jgi:hypothetical protein